jgi:hypothetical protein
LNIIKYRIYKFHDKNVGVTIDEVSSSTLVEDFSLSWLKTPNKLVMKTWNKTKKENKRNGEGRMIEIKLN